MGVPAGLRVAQTHQHARVAVFSWGLMEHLCEGCWPDQGSPVTPAAQHKVRRNARGDPKDPQVTVHMLTAQGHREMTQPWEGPTHYNPRVGLRLARV